MPQGAIEGLKMGHQFVYTPAEQSLRRIRAAIWANVSAKELARLTREARKYHKLSHIQWVIQTTRAAMAARGQTPPNAPLHPLNINTNWLGICIVCQEPSQGSPCRRCETDPEYRAKWLDQDGQPLPWYVEAKRERDRHVQAYHRNQRRMREVGSMQPKPTGKRGRPKKPGHPIPGIHPLTQS